ncbi:hypothetical protein POM88_000391 [Heracleum sosnowskyi]|uniref:Histidine kinase/HSP90-like ATPase domain-containing protein n=1 Tax=Heracleum sosnowskyi TaxID=360622 RepID=A0AAD8N9P6_9APIA|nr:hypothetical protein POM88_000391 [Heracleum sosnowskyi]
MIRGINAIRRKLHASAKDDSEELVDPPKVEDRIGAVPHGLSTDSDVAKREAESMSRKTLRSNAERLEFQAEVSRLMDIIINSLYTNKDIFLRELISNASDALDKIRFLSLTDKEVLGEGDTTKLDIQIMLDTDQKILSIRDRGIGMTKEDLIKNLGTIAKSGTPAFVEKMQTSDYVEVNSKHNDDKQYVRESKADGAFAMSEDTWNEPLGRGTEIRLHPREEAGEYTEESKFKNSHSSSPLSIFHLNHSGERNTYVIKRTRCTFEAIVVCFIGDVRGRGLMVGIELVTNKKDKTPAKAKTAVLFEKLRGMVGMELLKMMVVGQTICRPQLK